MILFISSILALSFLCYFINSVGFVTFLGTDVSLLTPTCGLSPVPVLWYRTSMLQKIG